MSHHHRFDVAHSSQTSGGGLAEDGGENVLFATTTPSGMPTRQADGGASTDWGAIATAVLPVALSVYQQQQMTRLNIARINAGQPPLSRSEYAAVYRAPSAEVQIGATESAQRMMMFLGLGVLGLVGLRAAKII